MNRIIIISGIDGSGKTTIIEAVEHELAKQNCASRYVWLRYNHYLTKILLAFCRIIGLTKYEHFKHSRVGYHNFDGSKIISWLFVFFTFIDTLGVAIVKVYLPAIFSKKIIICDRWIIDILIDLEVDTGLTLSQESFVSRLFNSLIPENSQYFIILRDFDVVRRIRDESINDRNFPRRFKLYERHAKDARVQVINNNGNLENTIRQVVDLVSL